MIVRAAKATERDAQPTPDAEIMLQLAGGQLGALGELYDRYQAPLRSFLARATRDAHDVDDLLQAVFLAAAKSADRYDGRSSCRPWLVGIAAQLVRRRRQTFGRLIAVLSAFKGTQPNSGDPREALQARTDIERALAQLSDAKRMTVLMAEVEGMSCAEIAEALAVPIGTVWTRLHAARRELRHALDSEGGGKP
jgi:RNA polymerase sigma-70 factor (ECF subfamily)